MAAKDDIEPQAFEMWCSDGRIGAGQSVTVNPIGSLTADCHYGASASGVVYGTLTPLSRSLKSPRLRSLINIPNLVLQLTYHCCQSVYWEAAQANYPALLVSGNFGFEMSKQGLKESTVGINLNPVGTAFRGVEDSSLTTVYPSQIRGLIYVSHEIGLYNGLAENDIYGVLMVRGKTRGAGDLFLNYRNIFQLYPPPGFRSFDQVRMAAGSARRVATP